MPLTIPVRTALVCGLVAALGGMASAQEAVSPPAACTGTSCALVFDWGPGKTAGTYGADQRYGSGDDFEAAVRHALSVRGVSVQGGTSASLTVTLRPKVDMRAMCDQMAGTGTRYSCAVVSDVAINFTSAEPSVKPPGAMRLDNRCGGERTYLTMSKFGQYVGDMVWWSMLPAGTKERRPAMRC
jgi:hypothetical protein